MAQVNPLTPKQIAPSTVPISRINFTGDVKEIEEQQDVELVRSVYERVFHPPYPNNFKVHKGAKEIFAKNPEIFKFFELQIIDVHYMKGSGETDPILFDDFVSEFTHLLTEAETTKRRSDCASFKAAD